MPRGRPRPQEILHADWSIATSGVCGAHLQSAGFHLPLFLPTDPGQAPATPAAAAPPPPAPHTTAAPAAPAAAGRATAENLQPGARRMVAIFDYDPRESSPNTDIEVLFVHVSFCLSGRDTVILIGCLLFFLPGGADLQRGRHHTCVW